MLLKETENWEWIHERIWRHHANLSWTNEWTPFCSYVNFLAVSESLSPIFKGIKHKFVVRTCTRIIELGVGGSEDDSEITIGNATWCCLVLSMCYFISFYLHSQGWLQAHPTPIYYEFSMNRVLWSSFVKWFRGKLPFHAWLPRLRAQGRSGTVKEGIRIELSWKSGWSLLPPELCQEATLSRPRELRVFCEPAMSHLTQGGCGCLDLQSAGERVGGSWEKTRKWWVGVGAGLRLLPVLHIWETQRVNSGHLLWCLLVSWSPQDARHRVWFCEYRDDQD